VTSALSLALALFCVNPVGAATINDLQNDYDGGLHHNTNPTAQPEC
jgi:hypothetical protein